MRILKPWDELSVEQRRAITDCTGLSYADLPQVWNNILDHCTHELRTPDQWTERDKKELDNTLQNVWDSPDFVEIVATKALKIATRPPKEMTAVERMDDWVARCSSATQELWQAVKAEKGIS